MMYRNLKLFLLLLTASFPAYADESPAPYSSIREELLLPENFEKRITNIDEVKKNPHFLKLIDSRIQHIPKNIQLYAYTSESVDDTSWGCAWRAIQTALSPFMEGDVAKIPSFTELYTKYGSRSFLEAEYLSLYPETNEKWLAPHEEWHMWADPFIGHMILHHLGFNSKLVAVHEIPKSNSPSVADEFVTFKGFKKALLKHFKHGGATIMIDNGRYSLNILGVGNNKGNLFLLIGDPHLIKERDDHPLNGLYVVELNKDGEQVSINYPAVHNHYDTGSFQELNFSETTTWLTLFTW